MNCRERVLTTLDHDEPDKVPYWEHLVSAPTLTTRLGWRKPPKPDADKKFMNLLDTVTSIKGLPAFGNKLMTGIFKYNKMIAPFLGPFLKNYLKLHKYLKIDVTSLPLGPFPYEFVPPNKFVSPFGVLYGIKSVGGYFSTPYAGGLFKNKEDYKEYTKKLDCAEPMGMLLFRKILKTTPPEELFVVPGIYTGLFDTTWQCFGIKYFSHLLVKDKSFLKHVIHDRERYYREVIKRFIDEFPIDAFFIGDDLAYGTRPFVSPKQFKEFFLPSYKRISNMMHKRGVKLIIHTDGNILPIVDSLIEYADAIHPWQASAHIDIAEVKKQYGDKVTLIGNVPIRLLVDGPRSEIADYVKNLLQTCAPGGGYMLSSGNSIIPAMPWQNYITMLSTFWKYRNYKD